MFEETLNSLPKLSPELLWILIVAFIIAFLLAFSVGANDVSNSFGTSVGSKVLTVTQACILATFFEVAGATLLGYSVCDTFRSSIYNVDDYKNNQKELMLGALSCLIGSAAWNIIATALKMPISGTHSIVGATIGFSIVLKGWSSIKWKLIARIVASWFASPLFAGAISSIIYIIISKTVIRKVNPLKYGLKALPLFYGATIFINVASVLISEKDFFGLNQISSYAGLFLSLVIAAIVITIVALIYVPKLKKQINDEIVLKTTTTNKNNNIKFKGNNNNNNTSGQTVLQLETMKGVLVDKEGGATTEQQQQKSISCTGFDNVAFRSDTGSSGNLFQYKKIDRTNDERAINVLPEKPKREITLSANELMKTTTTSNLGKQPDITNEKPPLAPKPIYLLKKQSNKQQQQLEEIDLSSPSNVTSGGSIETTQNVEGEKIEKIKISRDIDKKKKFSSSGGGGGGDDDDGYIVGLNGKPGSIRGERLEVFRLFSALQILTACFASFAHGTNDVSNAVAPLIPIWNIYADGKEDVTKQTQIWILLFGGIGICTGLWAWGRAIMGTVGSGLTQLTPSKGFSIELGAAISVLTATKLGLPISTTHCKVGSVVIVGLISNKFCSHDNNLLMNGMSQEDREKNEQNRAVDWKLFGNIAITWIVTVPLAAIASALIMFILKTVAL